MTSAMKVMKTLITLAALTVAVPSLAATYDIDTSHSSVEFKIKHLGISTVKGSFDTFSGHFDYVAGDASRWNSVATIELASVDTGNEKRDEHLRSADFFDVENKPNMVFELTRAEMTGDDEGMLYGTLALNGKTLPVVLDLEFNGEVIDPWGNAKVGFSATGKINRKDWGLTYGKVLESGGLLIGDEVKISLEIAGVKRAEANG